ncbi:MAG: penicillin-binding protein 2 [Burkholderiaceae bacterium]|nr:MAG: penicillin-binding protein 2 [Burkholderiaceae bacterium]
MFEFKKTSLHQKRQVMLRVVVAGVIAALCFGLLIGRLWYLQVVRYEGFAARADENRIAVVPIPPRRGEILDRNGVVLARNYRDYTLEVVPANVERNMDSMLDALNKIVYISPYSRRRFKQSLSQSGRYAHILLRNNLNETEAAWFAAHAYEFRGVELRARWVREYPQGELAAHVLGYVGRISERDKAMLEKEGRAGNYRGTDSIGRKGVEKTWEKALHGRTGVEEVEVTATGRPVRTLKRTDPVPGSDVKLSLDIGLEKVAQEQFAGKRGALVAIDPKTGEVLALVSSPSFDPNLFVNGIDAESWRELNDSPDHPLIDRAVSSAYPIGSTYKPFVALAALQLNKRSATQKISDPGYYEFGGQKFHNAGGAVYGPTDMHRAIVVSSDTYFFSLGPIIGVDALHDFTKQFGFGQITGIDLDGEKRGVLPSKAWKRHAYKNPAQKRWYAGESVSVAVGQGYNAFTLLQLAQATSVLANNGVYMKPHLVKDVRDPKTHAFVPVPDKPLYTIKLKPENLKVVQDAMADVIRVGTARRAFVGATYQAAGKTGTAQLYSLRGSKYHSSSVSERLRDHALFMAYAPFDDPKIAVALIVENGGWGASVAAPIARKVLDYWLSPSRNTANTLMAGAAAGRKAANEAATAAAAKTAANGAPSGGTAAAAVASDAASEGGLGESPDAVVKPEDLPPEDSGDDNASSSSDSQDDAATADGDAP